MKIELLQMTMTNFKGEASRTIDFTEMTEVYGKNASGKSRIKDAFIWCLFGKDAEDRKDYQIKSLDADNEPMHRASHSVTIILRIDGIDTKLERTLEENWVKKRGSETEEFEGHNTSFKVNDIPNKLSEYQQVVNGIITEDLFKLLTNPLYFNVLMGWKDRRDMISKIRDIPYDEALKTIPELTEYFNGLNGASIEKRREELAAKLAIRKKELKDIPARINENERKLQKDPDYAQLKKDLEQKTFMIKEIDEQLEREGAKYDKLNEANQAKQNEIRKLEKQISDIKYEQQEKREENARSYTMTVAQTKQNIEFISSAIRSMETLIDNKRTEIKTLEEKNTELRSDWSDTNQEIIHFDENEFICPTCKRPFEATEIESKKEHMQVNFNRDKAARLASINAKGLNNKTLMDDLFKEIKDLEDQCRKKKTEREEEEKKIATITGPAPSEPTPDPEIKKLEGKVEEIRKTITEVKIPDNADLKGDRKDIELEVATIKDLLRIQEENESIQQRINQLEDEKRTISQDIATLEREQFKCEKIANTRAKLVEESINELFTTVKFKMFKQLINGGIEETCETLINGVPYPAANRAAQINSGLEVIRTLSDFFNIYCPVWIDNREAVTEIPEMKCQVINLIVDPNHKELKIVLH